MSLIALSGSLLAGNIEITVKPSFTGTAHGECDAATRREIRSWLNNQYQAAHDSPPPWIGPEEPIVEESVPFAEFMPDAQYFWPILTQDSHGRAIAYKGASGKIYGLNGRRFLANRQTEDGQPRYHVGIDLWGQAGDIVVACESGVIINHYHFYHGVHALLVEGKSGLVINYGEVKADSWKEFRLDKGSAVVAGQKIARVGKMTNDSMCHFETYIKGTKENKRFFPGQPRPPALLNPTKFLLHLAAKGH